MTKELPSSISLKNLSDIIDIDTLSLTGYRTRQLKRVIGKPESLSQMSRLVRSQLAVKTAVAVCEQNPGLPMVQTLSQITGCFHPSVPADI